MLINGIFSRLPCNSAPRNRRVIFALLFASAIFRVFEAVGHAQYVNPGAGCIVHDGTIYYYQYTATGPDGGYDDYYWAIYSTGDYVWVNQTEILMDSSGHYYGPGFDYQQGDAWHGYFLSDGFDIFGIPSDPVVVLSRDEFIGADPYVVYDGNFSWATSYAITPFYNDTSEYWVTYTTPNSGYCRLGPSWYWMPGALANAQGWGNYNTVIDATYIWPGPNIFALDPPQQVYLNGQVYNLTSTEVDAGGQYYTDTLYYEGTTGYVDIQRNAASGATTASYMWGTSASGEAFSTTFNPDTWVVGAIANDLAINFSAPGGTPAHGPPFLSWGGNLLLFYYTAGDGKDVYWNAGNEGGDYSVLLAQDDTLLAIHGETETAATYDPGTSHFNFSGVALDNFFALDANGNPLGLPTGAMMLFGTAGTGSSILCSDGNSYPATYTFQRPDGYWGVKYVGPPTGAAFVIADASGNYNSQLYLATTGGMLINAISGWPVSNAYPSQLYVNGVVCPLQWAGNTVGGTGQNTYGGAPYVSADNSTTVTLGWNWNSGSPTWTWSMNSQSGAWDYANTFSNVPSGTFISLTPPPTNPSYGPPGLAWNGSTLTFIGWESQMLGLDVYEGSGTRMTIDATGTAKIINIGSGATLFTGTYDPSTYTFDFGAVNYGTVSSKDSLGHLLKDSTPVPESGLTLWLAADSGVTTAVVNGQPTNAVMAWADQSGKNNNAGWVTNWHQPALFQNLVNGRPAVNFDGNAVLGIPTLNTWAAGGEVFIVVASAGSTDANAGLWDFGSSDLTSYNWRNGAIYDSFGTTVQYNEGVPNQDLTQFHIYEAASKPGLWQSWIDGVTNFVSKTNTVGFTLTPYLGCNAIPSANCCFLGSIAEVLVYDHTLSSSERHQALTYLSERYAVVPKATAPTNLTVKAVNGTTALVSWTAPINDALITYNIQRRENGGAWTLVSTNSAAQSFVDSGLNPSSNYVYEVQTLTTRGPSSWVSSDILNLSVAPSGLFPRAGMVEWLMADGALESPTQYLPDYSGAGNDAWSTNPPQRPLVIPNIVNGKPVLHFTGAAYIPTAIGLPTNFLTGASAVHAFAVVRSTPPPGVVSGLWDLGNPVNPTYYPHPNGSIYDAAGTNGGNGVYAWKPAQDLTQFHVYEVCAQTGLWQSWINGVPQLRKTPNTLQFSLGPVIGANAANTGFIGDIAEVVIFNRPLSTDERQGMLTYLNQKYALVPSPAVPATVAAVQLNSAQTLITWDWSANNNEVSYVIERKTGSGGTYTTLATVQNAGSYIDTTVVAGQQYYYRVYAANLTGRSDYSEATGVATPMMEGGTMPLSGIALWLMADGAWESPVGYLTDYSGNGNDAQQQTAIAQPTLLQNAANGKPALHFLGNGQATWNIQVLGLPDVLHAATATAAEAVIVLRASSVTGNSSAPWNFGTANYAYYADPNGNIADNFGTTTQMNEGIPSQDITQFHVYEVCSQPGLWQSWIDGIPLFQSTANTTPSFTATPTIGNNLANNGFAGDIAEIVVYNRPLSSVERKGILSYLTQKYALEAAPVTPTGLSAVALNGNSAMVTWNEPVTNSSTYFSLWRQQGTSDPVLVTTLEGVKTFIDNSVSSANSYTYQVQAYNSYGASALCPAATLQWNMPAVASLPTSGMKLWIMGDGVVVTPIAYLPDYSGNDNDGWQPTFTLRPLLMQNVLNGKPVLRFNGNIVIPFVGYGQLVNLPDFMGAATATAAEALVVLRANSRTVNSSGLWNFGGNASWYSNPNGNVYESFGTTSQFNEGNPAADITKFHVYDVSSQAGHWQSWIDGAPLFSSTSNTFSFPAAPGLGMNVSGSGFTGDIAELVVYNRALTTQERQAWQQYFAIKYFLSGLDPDGDGLTTGQELQLGLNPLNAYTYGGTVNDGAAYTQGLLPLYPTPLYPDPNGPPGTNPLQPGSGVPVITLTSPAGVVLH